MEMESIMRGYGSVTECRNGIYGNCKTLKMSHQ